MNQFSSEVLHEILDQQLTDEAWYSIIDSMLLNCYQRDYNEIFFEAIKKGHLQVIKIFSELGVNAFKIAEDEKEEENKKPPIFGLAYLHNDKIEPDQILQTIFSGMKEYYMEKLARARKGAFSYSRPPKDDCEAQPKTLLEECICVGNTRVTDYLIEHSNSNVQGPYGTTPLHWAVLKNNEPLIIKLLKQGLCPYDEGVFDLSRHEESGLVYKCFDGSYQNMKRALQQGSDCFELAKLRVPPNHDFLDREYTNLVRNKKEDETKTEKNWIFMGNLPMKNEETEDKITETENTSVNKRCLPTVFSTDDNDDSEIVKVTDCHGVSTIYDLSKIEDQEKASNTKAQSGLYDSLLEELREFLENSRNPYYEGP